MTWGSQTNGTAGTTLSAANSLVGTQQNDYVGSNPSLTANITTLTNGNYVVVSTNWQNVSNTAMQAGAVTWGSGITGVAGPVDMSNSLVGTQMGDFDSSVSINELLVNGNYVVLNPDWSGTIGAATWGSGTAVLAGNVDTSTSLIGSTAGDKIGTNIAYLSNGNYVVTSTTWSDPISVVSAVGAATWGEGTVGVKGFVDGSLTGNSLAGTQANDNVGNAVLALTNGNYVVTSLNWAYKDPAMVNHPSAGAATWGDGHTGLTIGPVSQSNSLTGTQQGDVVGSGGAMEVTNGIYDNYVVLSDSWSNGPPHMFGGSGAATWGNGLGGTVGPVTVSNSLVGTHPGDAIGQQGIALTKGNYVVFSSVWAYEYAHSMFNIFAGSATWGNGAAPGPVGAVSMSNSLIGTQFNDIVARNGVNALPNGNYVVLSPEWQYVPNAAMQSGAVTWGDGTVGVSGILSPSNSLVGSSGGDDVGDVISVLSNSNYVVNAPNWHYMGIGSAGASIWGSGTSGVKGVVSETTNALVGTQTNDDVGAGIFELPDGNYFVQSLNWSFGVGQSTSGAATWANGNTGVIGIVSEFNSLVGTQAGDFIGINAVPLTNGKYVVGSSSWSNGTMMGAGALAWADQASGIVGVVSELNSLVGTQMGDAVGSNGILALSNGNYVVVSPNWQYFPNTATLAGAVTWANGSTGLIGPVTSSNSLVGTQMGDSVGSNGVVQLSNDNYVVVSPHWQYFPNTATQAGAVTWGSGISGVAGPVSSSNSLVGTQAMDMVGNFGALGISSEFYAVLSANWANGGNTQAGAVSIVESASGLLCDGTHGPLSSANSFTLNSPMTQLVADSLGQGVILVEFNNDPGQPRIFSIAGFFVVPSSPSSTSFSFAKGIHNFAVAISEPYYDWNILGLSNCDCEFPPETTMWTLKNRKTCHKPPKILKNR